ncbi:uncharacterized protein LOC141914601 [Tubulanus polymorphus]|uniref:uncharacterized protein LOC141914601 n=1 Tax=Tubulanus polymorphus TaxID=672921 RepID=UPI003DA5245A
MESTDVPSTNERLDPVNNASGRILQIPFMIPTSSGVATINLLQDMTKYQSHDNNTLMNSMYNRSRAPDDLQFLTHYTDNSTECQDIVTSRVEDIPVDNYEIVDLAVEASQPLDEPHEIANLTLKPYKIFSEVTAKLPQAIFSLIHGSEDLMLTSLHDDYKVECTLDSASTSVLFKGDIMNLMKLENSLRQQIFGLSATSTTQTQTDTVKFKDSSIYCDILKPVFSKRGREVKSHSFGQNFIDDSMITGDQVADDEYNHVKRRKQKGLAAVTSSSKHEVEMSNGTHAMDEPNRITTK